MKRMRDSVAYVCVRILVAFLLTVAAAGQSAPPQPRVDKSGELDIRVGEPFEIASSHGRIWFATIHQFPGKEIMVTFGTNADAVGAQIYSAYSISNDEGQSWSHRFTMGDETHDSGGWSAAPEQDDAIWHLYTPLDPSPSGQSQEFHVTLSKFWRGGREVNINRDVLLKLIEPMHMISLETMPPLQKDYETSTETISGFPFGPIVHARNGDLLTPIYYKAKSDPRYFRLGMIRSADNGKSWTEYSTIAALKPTESPWTWMGKDGPCEAGLVRVADGRLYAVYRTGSDGQMGQAWSSDDGATWTSPSPMPYKGVSPRMRRLSNGVLALTYGRPGPVTIMFNADGTGENWTNITPLFTGMSTHYNDFIEVEPGKLLLVYDSVPYGWNLIPEFDKTSKDTVYGRFIEVKRK